MATTGLGPSICGTGAMSASGATPALILSRVAPSSSPDDNDAMAEGLINEDFEHWLKP
jgi:hypothetical protein